MTDDTIQALLQKRLSDPTVAVKHGSLQWTWIQYLAESTARAAALIAAADPRRPVHIGALLGNTPEMLTQMAAAGLGGYVLCGLNTTRRGEALAADIRRADCQFIVTDAEHRPLLDGLDLEGTQILDTSTPRWAEFVGGAGELVPHRQVTAMDAFMMIFTSGTSGNPKAVPVSHLMATIAGLSLTGRFGLTEGDTCYVSMPLFHSNAVVAGWAPAVASGAAIVPARFSASNFLDDVRRYGATYMNYVGKPLAYILATPERDDDADNPLRVAFGNEANDKDIEEFARRFGVRVEDGFGSTENAVIVIREPGTPKGSIGRGVDGVAVYDSETVTECAVARFDAHGALANADEAVGELVNSAGSGFFTGYYNDPEANAERMRHGMYWSGDLAYRDAEGWIYLAGRTADWMRVDGENLAAAPIERILLRHSAINRVAVYAVPDGRVGDQVMAAVVRNTGATLDPDSFEAFLDTQPDLSPKARPRYVRIAADLPSTATHKVLKRRLIAEGTAVGEGEILWEREPHGTAYRRAAPTPNPDSYAPDGGSAPSPVAPV
ncbi:fatty-acid--CoA ligase FadD1 [Mycobacterium malmoense]|uniref:Acyl-CoA synthetase n=1 Tax=Mycobacterium malmoense TaxID=1780 RepID=A0ABX3SZE4_MYCMA|nr:fatty-acid--CoA ligase FadD1 [Mycobacterium malmoense]ORA85599.1 acyl-CoA synthetase [Mycobacterium malmoense]QZA17839.1 fatty-acid--CoA ligase FadD1 [Mycobacterium malmoense]UNB94616.1 AMP-binding protein [Mycobacterium malmoense]